MAAMKIRTLYRLLLPAALLAGWQPGLPAFAQQAEAIDHADYPRRDFERELRATPMGPILDALERNYPEDARALLARLYAIAYEHRVAPLRAEELLHREMMALLRSKAADLAAAPAPALRRLLEEEIRLYRAIQAPDVEWCGALSASAPGHSWILPPGLAEQVPPKTIAMIEAAGAGRRTPQARRLPPSADDMADWGLAIIAGDRDGRLRALLRNPEALRAAPPDQQCAAGLLAYEAALGLPLEKSANITALLMMQSMGTMPARAD